MRLLIIVFCCLLHEAVFAQEPLISGYLGKVNYVSLKLNTGLRRNHPESWKRNHEVTNSRFGKLSIKSEIEINYGHIFSDNFVLEVVGGHNSTSIDLNYLNDPFLYHLPNNTTLNYQDYYGYPKIVDWYTGVGAKLFRRKRGALSPLGTYIKLGVNYHTYGITFNEIFADLTDRSSQIYYSTLFEYGRYYYRFVEYNGSAGISRALSDNIIYDVGITAGWGFAGPGFYKEEDLPFKDYFQRQLLSVLKKYHMVKMYGSVSYMF